MLVRTLTREQVRKVDQIAIDEFGIPGIVLMENAGRGAAELLLSLGVDGPVTICCGRGNNGGDGFVMARHLENRGCKVRILLLCEPERLRDDSAVNYRIVAAAGTALSVCPGPATHESAALLLNNSAWIVDALLGTGAQGNVREPYASAIHAINHASANVLAVDLPSGLDCDTGQPANCCVEAGHTATFVARKPGFDVPSSTQFTGTVHVVDIGIPQTLLDRHFRDSQQVTGS